jgi:hypothetical protein
VLKKVKKSATEYLYGYAAAADPYRRYNPGGNFLASWLVLVGEVKTLFSSGAYEKFRQMDRYVSEGEIGKVSGFIQTKSAALEALRQETGSLAD